ncbi:hypothetical protein SCP_1700790 [Sparassis crispa]|uniref:Uncharacterized protein n=1 Tax=Sparassis crispa TaxID=139825 RepID=A0A401H5R3_9APHY|nr:hypothetical protein SCP_1700790 [Sparassis crispa]GBE89754.1 hypothetical protein SCP_1700790 [Sparassis crispa]
MRRGWRRKQPPCEPESASNAKGGHHDDDDGGQRNDDNISASQLNSDTDVKGEDDPDVRPKDRRDGKKVAKAAKTRRGWKRKQPPREPESASNMRGGGRAPAKKPRVAGSVAGEKRLTQAATLPRKSTRIAIPTKRKRFSK